MIQVILFVMGLLNGVEEMENKHVYFYSLPNGAVFDHKKKTFVKNGEEEALSLKDCTRQLFEIHYGCIVPNDMYVDSVIRS